MQAMTSGLRINSAKGFRFTPFSFEPKYVNARTDRIFASGIITAAQMAVSATPSSPNKTPVIVSAINVFQRELD